MMCMYVYMMCVYVCIYDVYACIYDEYVCPCLRALLRRAHTASFIMSFPLCVRNAFDVFSICILWNLSSISLIWLARDDAIYPCILVVSKINLYSINKSFIHRVMSSNARKTDRQYQSFHVYIYIYIYIYILCTIIIYFMYQIRRASSLNISHK